MKQVIRTREKSAGHVKQTKEKTAAYMFLFCARKIGAMAPYPNQIAFMHRPRSQSRGVLKA
ncbi:hypothetical protein [Paraburkholderia sp.]|uniref:hypothetical protein n=1 Tax=Paraburkholderia sp. TaxID=1926495 RepID=UPI003C72BD24